MPSLADITVKKNDGTTDITFTGVAASAGDKSPSVWRSNTVGDAVLQRPVLSTVGEVNGTRTARRLRIHFAYPSVVTGTDGRKTITDTFLFDGVVTVPLGMDDDDINEAASQSSNLVGSSLMKSMMKLGMGAT